MRTPRLLVRLVTGGTALVLLSCGSETGVFDPPGISTALLPNGVVGQPYTTRLRAFGGDGAFAWDLAEGALPAGISLDADGLLSGTPVAADTAQLTVRVTSGDGQITTAALTLSIFDMLTVTPTDPTPGVVGAAYSAALEATGGDGSYVWDLTGVLPAGLSLDPAGIVSGTPTAADSATVVFVVSSGDGQITSRETTVITYEVVAVATVEVPTGVVGTAYDEPLEADGGDNEYTWTLVAGSLPAGLALDPAGNLTGTPTAADSVSVTVQVVSGDGQTATGSLTVRVYDPLEVTTSSVPPGVTTVAYSTTLTATGGDGVFVWTLLAGTLPGGLALDSLGVLSGTPAATDSATVTVGVTSGDGQSTSVSLTVHTFDALAVATTTVATGVVGEPYSAPLQGIGGDGAYSWTLVSGTPPAGLTVDGPGLLQGTPTTADTATITLGVSSGDGQSATADLFVATFDALLADDDTLPNGVVGTPYSAAPNAFGGDGSHTWSVLTGTLPAGLVLDPTGAVIGTPSAAGTSTVTAQIASGDGQTTTADLTVSTFDALSIDTGSLPTGVVGTSFSSSLDASGGDGSYGWSLVSGSLPGGITLDAGALTGTPTASGSHPLTLRASSGDGQITDVDLTLTVYEVLDVATISAPNGVVGRTYSFSLAATGGDDTYTWSRTSGALPDGLTLDPDGTVSGSSTVAESQAFTVEVVSGDGQTASRALSLSTFAALVLETSSLPDGTVGQAYDETLTASGADGSFTWTADAGAPPDGLTLSTSGSLTGTPTTVEAPVFTVRVTSGDGQTSTTDLAVKTSALASFIEGYAGDVSIDRGESIDLHISTDGSEHLLEVYRMGWYGGEGRQLVLSVDSVGGQLQTTPTPDPTTGRIEASWTTTYTLDTDPSWTSGVYLVELGAEPDAFGRINFVIRDDAAPQDLVVQIPVTTYQAYNNWGGKSLYDYNSTGGRAYEVSFDRPYADWDGAGDFFNGDYGLIRWLEREGYQATYVTSVDLERDASVLSGPKVFISDYHDEYWSRNMRENLVAAQNAGLHSAFFDANNIYWQIRFADSSGGVPNRVMVGYKDAGLDPLAAGQPDLATVRWREAPVNEPENGVLGVMYESDFTYGDSYPWVVQNSSHWIYDGTGLNDNDEIDGLVGYEYDRVFANGFTPAGLTVLAASPVVDGGGTPGTHNAAIFTLPSGAIVFTAGTIYWPWKLDDNDAVANGEDARVQQMTRNLLDHMLSGG